jgi:hypothetical protein
MRSAERLWHRALRLANAFVDTVSNGDGESMGAGCPCITRWGPDLVPIPAKDMSPLSRHVHGIPARYNSCAALVVPCNVGGSAIL